jgi:hypothetical protein
MLTEVAAVEIDIGDRPDPIKREEDPLALPIPGPGEARAIPGPTVRAGIFGCPGVR